MLREEGFDLNNEMLLRGPQVRRLHILFLFTYSLQVPSNLASVC